MTPVTPTTLPPFSEAVTQADVESNTTFFLSKHSIKTTILSIAQYILRIGTYSSLFGNHKTDPYSPSVATLYKRLVSGIEGVNPLEHVRKDGERVKAAIIEKYGSGSALAALQTSGNDTNAFLSSNISKVIQRPLADFEDLYYALLARLHDLTHHLGVRLRSYFNTLSDPVYPSGPSIASFHATLLDFWNTLNAVDLVTPLHNNVRRARLAAMRDEVVRAAVADLIPADEAEQHLTDLDAFGADKAVEGLMWVGQLAPGMIGALLTERWRIRFGVEKEVIRKAEKEARDATRKVAIAAKKMHMNRRSAEMKLKGQKRAVRPGTQALWKVVEVMQRRESKGAVKKQNDLVRKVDKVSISEAPQQVANTQHVDVELGGPVRAHTPLHTTITHSVVMYDDMNMDWELKTRRVSAYSQYLRSLASQRAQNMVQSTRLDNTALFVISRGIGEDNHPMES